MLGIYDFYTNILFNILLYVCIGLHKITTYRELLTQAP